MPIDKLKWGLSNAVPADAVSAWGCRAILDNHGYLDIVPDRIDRQGSDKVFSVLDAEFPPNMLKAKVSNLVLSGGLDPRLNTQVELYRSDTLTVVGNTNASYGYLYIAAWTTAG